MNANEQVSNKYRRLQNHVHRAQRRAERHAVKRILKKQSGLHPRASRTL